MELIISSIRNNNNNNNNNNDNNDDDDDDSVIYLFLLNSCKNYRLIRKVYFLDICLRQICTQQEHR